MTANHRDYRQATEAELADERRRIDAATARHPAGSALAGKSTAATNAVSVWRANDLDAGWLLGIAAGRSTSGCTDRAGLPARRRNRHRKGGALNEKTPGSNRGPLFVR
jgi:hypothetical protein